VQVVAAERAESVSVRWTDVTAESGIAFEHSDGRSGRKYLPETLGSGAAWFDYDNDGDVDLYVVNGSDLPGSRSLEPPTNRLYRNNADGTFTDVSQQSGAHDTGYGHGCAVGDYDNDGDDDLYVANFGPNVLYRNNGDGTFTDVTRHAGVGDARWSASAAFLDYDRDGYLDLYVVNYLDYPLERAIPATINGTLAYRSPVDQLPDSRFTAERDTLYRNNRNGTFSDVSEDAGITARRIGLAVAVGDYDNDGDPDIAVANDMEPDLLWRNNGNGTFTDVAYTVGTGYDENGVPGSGMGVAFGDYDNDGALDLLVSNASSMPAYLFRNEGDGCFADVSFASGVGEVTLPFFKWATDFLDFDNDGWNDIFVVNGHLQDNVERFSDQTYEQQNLLLKNVVGRFVDVSYETGLSDLEERVGRGAAFGDYDNDGDTDVFIVNADGRATLLRNDGGNRRNWLRIALVGTRGNRDGYGARVRVVTGALTQTKEIRSGSGYLSHSDTHVLFGLGGASKADSVEIRWLDGFTERFANVPANRTVVFTEGSGMPYASR
jgi:hypothetical protein